MGNRVMQAGNGVTMITVTLHSLVYTNFCNAPDRRWAQGEKEVYLGLPKTSKIDKFETIVNG